MVPTPEGYMEHPNGHSLHSEEDFFVDIVRGVYLVRPLGVQALRG